MAVLIADICAFLKIGIRAKILFILFTVLEHALKPKNEPKP